MSWTDYALPALSISPPTPSPLLDFQGLRQAADFIARLRQTEPLSSNTAEIITSPSEE